MSCCRDVNFGVVGNCMDKLCSCDCGAVLGGVGAALGATGNVVGLLCDCLGNLDFGACDCDACDC
jgi:hypothetical protein